MTELDANGKAGDSAERESGGEVASQPTDTEPTASDMLVEAREAAGMSQKDVADQLFLTTTFIRYIDDGEFEKIPKPAFIKGYLRSYARVVNLPGEAVIEAYERGQSVTPQAPDLSRVTEDNVGSGSFTGPIVQTGVVGLVAIFVVAGLVWWFASDDGRNEAPVVTASETGPARSASTAGAPSALQREGAAPAGETDEATSQSVTVPEMPARLEAPGPGEATGPEAADAVTREPVTVSGAAEAETATMARVEDDRDLPAVPGTVAMESTTSEISGDVDIERVQDGDTQYITVYAGGENTLEFAFTDECWLEIEDGEGRKIYGDLNRAGDVMTVYGIAPFDVLFGRAPAATMIYEGQAVNLDRFTTRDQTARVRTARL